MRDVAGARNAVHHLSILESDDKPPHSISLLELVETGGDILELLLDGNGLDQVVSDVLQSFFGILHGPRTRTSQADAFRHEVLRSDGKGHFLRSWWPLELETVRASLMDIELTDSDADDDSSLAHICKGLFVGPGTGAGHQDSVRPSLSSLDDGSCDVLESISAMRPCEGGSYSYLLLHEIND